MTDIQFEDVAPWLPMPVGHRLAFMDELCKRPGTWALLGQHQSPGAARQTAYAIRKSLSPWPRPTGGHFEADAKTVLGEHRVWVRFVPKTRRTSRRRTAR